MIRKFNYTNRKKIPRDEINISLHKQGSELYFNAELRKENLKFPDEAKVYIEPYYGPTYLRYCFGNFGNIQQPENTAISEIKKISEKVYFRIKIVDESNESGLLLGFADKLPVTDDGDPEGKTSILPVVAVKMDTNEIWRINFDAIGDGMPTLEVNSEIEGIREITKGDTVFIGLVFPSAIRQIVTKIAFDNNFDIDGEGWESQWLKFTTYTLGISNVPDNNNDETLVNEWINDVVRAFCIKHKSLENYIKSFA